MEFLRAKRRQTAAKPVYNSSDTDDEYTFEQFYDGYVESKKLLLKNKLQLNSQKDAEV